MAIFILNFMIYFNNDFERKLIMDEKILIALISSGIGALTTKIFGIVEKMIEKHYENKKEEKEKKNRYLEKKEEVYIAAIERLLDFKIIFGGESENLKMMEWMNKRDEEFKKIAPKLRIYSSDKIFEDYFKLASFFYGMNIKFKLTEDSIRAYDIKITILAKKMQEDLGYREYDSDVITISCPKCKKKHDIFKKCPKCGIDYKQTMEELNKQMQNVKK